MARRAVAVLGATGLVGQRFISLLSRHPWFEIRVLAGSERVSKARYGETVNWIVEGSMPEEVRGLNIIYARPEELPLLLESENVDIVFSALPSNIALEYEFELAKRGFLVVSNASPLRLEPDIPLLNPEVNADHLDLIEAQKGFRGFEGAIVKVPNCTTAILTLSLKPLADSFSLELVVASSMQAISGAGLTGLPAMIIHDNLIPYIEGEEEKVEKESRKIMGEILGGNIKPAGFKITASTHRVPVLEGHTIAVFAKLKEEAPPQEAVKVIEEFRGNKIKNLNLPTAPEKPIIVRRENDRPQPRLDRMEGNGMSIVVGRLREDKALGGLKYIVLGHNTIRGAAGTGILIAELALARGLV